MTDSGPLGVPLSLRAHDLVDLLLEHLGQHSEPDADAEREESLFRCPHKLPECFLDTLREYGIIAGRLRDRYVATHGGSSFGLGRSTRHAPTRSGRAGGTAVTSKFHTRRDNLTQLRRRALFLDVLLSHDDVALRSIEPLLWLRVIEALRFRIQYGRRRHAGASGAGVLRMRSAAVLQRSPCSGSSARGVVFERGVSA
jgi:hypothetical protein